MWDAGGHPIEQIGFLQALQFPPKVRQPYQNINLVNSKLTWAYRLFILLILNIGYYYYQYHYDTWSICQTSDANVCYVPVSEFCSSFFNHPTQSGILQST